MTVELARRLLASGVPSSDIEAALLLSVARGIPIARALVDRGILSERTLEEELGRWAGVALRQVAVAKELWARLPTSMCRRLGAVPMRFDQAAQVVEVAAIDPLDPHVAIEFTFHLGQPVRVQRATLGVVEEALRRLELGEGEGSAQRNRRRTPAFPHGAPRSSAPPPPAEEVPIPLVRRVSTALLPAREAEPAPPPEALPTPRQRFGRGSEKSLPSVSFPSTPPPSDEDRERSLTPPLGTVAVRPEELPILGFDRTLPPEAGPPTERDVTPPPQWPTWSAPSATLEATFAQATFLPSNAPSSPPSEPPPSLLDTEAPSIPPAPIPQVPPPAAVTAPVGPPDLPRDRGLQSPLDRFAAFRDALDLVVGADSRDAVVESVLDAAAVLAPRIALFVARRDGFHGWRCSTSFGDQTALRALVMPLDQPSIFATATAAGFYLGPVPHTPGHGRLLAVMGTAGSDVAVTVVRVAGKPAMLLVAEGLDDTMRGTKSLGELAKAAGAALSRLLTYRSSTG